MSRFESADALHGAYLGELIRTPWILALVGFGSLAAGLIVGIAAAPALGAATTIVVALCSLAVVFLVARHQANRDFFAVFARQRGLELVEEGLPEVTPLLYAGSERTTNLAMRGELGGGFSGVVAHYTYIERLSAGGDGTGGGGVSATAYKLTIVLVEVPGTQEAFPKLLCHGRVKSQRTDKLDDTFRDKNRKRLRLESEALDRRFEIFYDPRDDEVRLRRLFSPTFMVWLTESMPSAFELVNESLCCFAYGHIDSAAELDQLIAGGVELARRLQAEALE
jgi:hypothetical protein